MNWMVIVNFLSNEKGQGPIAWLQKPNGLRNEVRAQGKDFWQISEIRQKIGQLNIINSSFVAFCLVKNFLFGQNAGVGPGPFQ